MKKIKLPKKMSTTYNFGTRGSVKNVLENFFNLNLEYHPFYIGNVRINNPLISAPMAGISDNTYRIFVKVFGSSLAYSEMIASYGIVNGNKKTTDLAFITDFERPVAIQLFGSDPDILAASAQIVEEQADIIDINMGCPIPKVLKTGSGGSLLREPELVKKIVKRVRGSIKKPLTIKLRLGWDINSINILEISKIVENEGADAIAIHGRTVKQGYSGYADYEYIKKVKEAVKIPVISSGDINSTSQVIKVMDYTKCDGVMIGRAARGNPWIFAIILLGLFLNKFTDVNLNKYDYNKYCHDKEYNVVNSYDYKNCLVKDVKTDKNSFNEITAKNTKCLKDFEKRIDLFKNNTIKAELLILYLKMLIIFKGEERAIKQFRKILGWAFKGDVKISKEISNLKNCFFKINSFSEAESLLKRIGGM